MSNFYFDPLNQTEVASLEEAKDWCSQNKYQVDEFKTDDLSFNSKGNLVLGNNSFKFSGDGFSRFCRSIDLPLRFALQSTNDLVEHNVNELLKNCEYKTLYFTSRRGDHSIVNVSPKEPKHAVSHLDLLDMFHEDGLKVKRIRLSDQGMVMSLTAPTQTVEPVVGDISELGASLVNSETGFGKTVGQLFFLRLVCSNGAVVPTQFGHVERKYGSKLTVAQVTTEFLNSLRKMLESTDKAKDGLKRLHEMKLTENHFSKLWRKIYGILSSDLETDKIVGVNAEFREGVILRERARTLENRSVFASRQTDSPTTDLEAYKVFNNVTRHAQEYKYIQAHELESIAGEMIRLPFIEN